MANWANVRYAIEGPKELLEITNGKIGTKEDVEKFNTEHEDSGTDDENFIYIHEFEIIE